MSYVVSSPELTYYRTPGKRSKLYCAILTPPIIYRARINQTFTTYDQVSAIVYDTGSGTLANVLPDMEVWIGSTLDGYDKGICRLRDKDATHFYLSETSEITFADNLYVTIVAAYGVWARPVRINESTQVVYMDETVYSDQHTNWDPMPNMGPNRVLELTGSSVSTTFNASTSFVPLSSVSAYAWSCSTASGSSNTTTYSPTFTFNSVGWHIVYLTLTGANGKTFFGVRYVYVWNEANPPSEVEITQPGKVSVETGGWEIEITMRSGAGLTQVHERAMVILFSKDWYGDNQVAIGPYSGAENIRFIGWISRETNHLASEVGSVTFVANNAAYWMGLIPSWPDGVELTNNTPSVWTQVQSLSVDLGVYHHLRWRTTVTRVMDVTLSGDIKLSQEVSSSAQNLWAQIQEMTWAQIYARPGVNYLNQLSVQVHPNIIPTAFRSAPTVMAITMDDIREGLDFDRTTVPPVGIVDMSGIQVISAGKGSAWFALAPGHSLPHYGQWDIQPNLLVGSQDQVILQAGLYRSWKNAKFPNIPMTFAMDIAKLDCFPNMKCTTIISSSDNVRGWSFSGGLFPTAVSLNMDADTGYLYTEAAFEEETFESIAMVGDTPGSGDTSGVPLPSLPPLPDIPSYIPGVGTGTDEGVFPVIVHDTTYGFLYTTDFDTGNPTWITVNSGLTTTQYQNANFMFVTPGGAFYVGRCDVMTSSDIGTGRARNPWIAWASSVGGVFTIIEDETTIFAKYVHPGLNHSIKACGYNPLVPEQVAYIIASGNTLDNTDCDLWIGSAGTYAQGGHTNKIHESNGFGGLTYGQNSWVYTGPSANLFNPAWVFTFSGDGMSLTSTMAFSDIAHHAHVRASTTGIIYIVSSASPFLKTSNNGVTWASPGSSPTSLDGFACDPTGSFFMCRSNGKERSTDGGATLLSMPSLPASSGWTFAYAGPGSSLPKFIGVRGVVYFSPDAGTTWYNYTGHLTDVAPLPVLDMAFVIGALV